MQLENMTVNTLTAYKPDGQYLYKIEPYGVSEEMSDTALDLPDVKSAITSGKATVWTGKSKIVGKQLTDYQRAQQSSARNTAQNVVTTNADGTRAPLTTEQVLGGRTPTIMASANDSQYDDLAIIGEPMLPPEARGAINTSDVFARMKQAPVIPPAPPILRRQAGVDSRVYIAPELAGVIARNGVALETDVTVADTDPKGGTAGSIENDMFGQQGNVRVAPNSVEANVPVVDPRISIAPETVGADIDAGQFIARGPRGSVTQGQVKDVVENMNEGIAKTQKSVEDLVKEVEQEKIKKAAKVKKVKANTDAVVDPMLQEFLAEPFLSQKWSVTKSTNVEFLNAVATSDAKISTLASKRLEELANASK